MSDNDLDSILNDDSDATKAEAAPAKDAEADKSAEAEAETTEGQTTEETKGEPEKGDEPAGAEDAPPASEEDQKVPLQALREERRKRQELERWKQEQERKAQEQQTPEEQPDWFNEPDKAASRFEQKFEQRLLNERFNMSEMMARNQYGSETIDSDLEKFEQLVEQRPHLRDELRGHSHPYDFVHQTVEKERALEEIGDPKSYKDKLREEVRKEVEAEMAKTAQPSGSKSKPSAPPSLANETSSSPRAGKGPPVHRSLDEILGN